MRRHRLTAVIPNTSDYQSDFWPQGEQIFTLKGAEYAYRSLVESMNEGAATLGPDGTVLYCNQRLADLIGLSMEHIIGQPAESLLPVE